ncbi:hypothetical protein [uncultured Pedobacter sp.]|uniref:hypothetical protein n=1 Tax=uncultured Pedobacter sp. TaxID=246139 RepID=UPI0025EDBAAD|nr:hypothetical protein [uncultured Pedobacter sp.]
MFEQSLPFFHVQTRKNKYRNDESFQKEFIFRFYRRNHKGLIKYIVSAKQYDDRFLTLDYYPKINLTPKPSSGGTVQDLRYRMLTRQNAFGYIGGTIMEIMLAIQEQTQIYTWGFLAANLPNETTNVNNKRYVVYTEVLRRSFKNKQRVLGNKDKSAIFVLPIELLEDKESIIKEYERLFSETN